MTCGLGKVSYETRDAAQAQTPALRKKRKYAKVYYCPACGAYHLTTKKKKKPYDRNREKYAARQRQRQP